MQFGNHASAHSLKILPTVVKTIPNISESTDFKCTDGGRYRIYETAAGYELAIYIRTATYWTVHRETNEYLNMQNIKNIERLDENSFKMEFINHPNVKQFQIHPIAVKTIPYISTSKDLKCADGGYYRMYETTAGYELEIWNQTETYWTVQSGTDDFLNLQNIMNIENGQYHNISFRVNHSTKSNTHPQTILVVFEVMDFNTPISHNYLRTAHQYESFLNSNITFTFKNNQIPELNRLKSNISHMIERLINIITNDPHL